MDVSLPPSTPASDIANKILNAFARNLEIKLQCVNQYNGQLVCINYEPAMPLLVNSDLGWQLAYLTKTEQNVTRLETRRALNIIGK